MRNIIFILSFLPSLAFTQVTLTIKKADGSIYWVDRFDKKVDGDAWLANEMKQPYWVKSFTSTFTGSDLVLKSGPVSDPVKVVNRAARMTALQNALDNWTLLSVIEQKAAMKALVEQVLDK